MDLARLLELVNDPTVKTILLFAGGFLLKRWPQFVNKAIPVALAVVSLLASILGAMFPAPVGGVVPTLYAASLVAPASFVSVLGTFWASPVVSALVPVILASGIQSTAKNTRQWAGFGWKLWHATGR